MALSSAFGFLELAEEVREGRVDGFDNEVLRWVAHHRTPLANDIFLSITALGSWSVVALLTIGLCLGTWLIGKRRLALVMLLAVGAVPMISRAFKAFYARARPSVVPHLDTVASASFPSGHTLGSVVFWCTAALLFAAHTARYRVRVFLMAYSLSVGALVALSRVYLGVHYPSDVVGGALVAVSWTLLVVVLDRLTLRRARRADDA